MSSNRRALLVAASHAQVPLPGAEGTMKHLAGFLEREAAYRAEVLSGIGATPGELRRRIDGWLLAGVKAGDRLVFAVSAHGAISLGRECFGLAGGDVYLDVLEKIWEKLPPGVALHCVYDLCRVEAATGQLQKRYASYALRTGRPRPPSPLYHPTPPRQWIELKGCQAGGLSYYESGPAGPGSGNLGDFTAALVAAARGLPSVREAVQAAYDRMPDRGILNLQLPEVVGPSNLIDGPVFGGEGVYRRVRCSFSTSVLSCLVSRWLMR